MDVVVIVVAVLIVIGLVAAVSVIDRRDSGQRGYHETLMSGGGRNVAQDLRATRGDSFGDG